MERKVEGFDGLMKLACRLLMDKQVVCTRSKTRMPTAVSEGTIQYSRRIRSWSKNDHPRSFSTCQSGVYYE
jgi:hypothetical protein